MQLLKFNNFVNKHFINESGNAVDGVIPIRQDQLDKTYDFIVKKILPIINIEEEAIRPIGSFKKKAPDQTSGDIDVAILVDRVAGNNSISIDGVLPFMEARFNRSGYPSTIFKGFNQISIAIPIEGDSKNGLVQLDFMLSDDLSFSSFMYYSPDFTKAESKYKGLYRNILLSCIVSNIDKKIIKTTEKGEVEEYRSFVLRTNQGIVEVTKSFRGRAGLLKTAKLLKDQDRFITNTPYIITKMAFGISTVPSDIMTFENIWARVTSNQFIHKNKITTILQEFKNKLEQSKVPVPSECVEKYPNIFI